MFTLANLAVHIWSSGRTGVPMYTAGNRHLTTLYDSCRLLEMIKSFIPVLSYDQHKGSCGRIAVLGGCQEYTGAPYFAAISSLKLGADLSHVFCAKEAAAVIKSYSPELIVHPILDSPCAVDETSVWLQRMHCLVIGPGLGRDQNLLKTTQDLIKRAKSMKLPMVIDADGLFLVTENPEIIKDYNKVVLTPNVAEFKRLFQAVLGHPADPQGTVQDVIRLSQALGHVTIIKKGEVDIISDGDRALVCCQPGSPRRCGGQGDLLSGTMGTFLHWAYMARAADISNVVFETYGPNMCAAYAACCLTRHCNHSAFQKSGRSMTTTDMIAEICPAFSSLYQ